MGEMARVRFGIFDFDPATGELRRGGVGVRIQSQPAQVLGLLVAHAGEIVTRETLRRAVWGTDTFVDFDRGLNFCVAQIRAALGDSAESPRFVRTIPKRGYQFIAPVGPVAAPPSSEPPPANQAVSGQPFAKQRLVTSALAAALVGTVILLGARLWILRLAPSAPASIRIAVLRFDNQTGSPDLDRFADGLTDSVVAELTDAGGGRYGVIGNAAILRQPRERRDLLAMGPAGSRCTWSAPARSAFPSTVWESRFHSQRGKPSTPRIRISIPCRRSSPWPRPRIFWSSASGSMGSGA